MRPEKLYYNRCLNKISVSQSISVITGVRWNYIPTELEDGWFRIYCYYITCVKSNNKGNGQVKITLGDWRTNEI